MGQTQDILCLKKIEVLKKQLQKLEDEQAM